MPEVDARIAMTASRAVYVQVLELMRTKVVEVKPSLAASLSARKMRLERLLEAIMAGQLHVELN
ncbi:MAG: hypothetical protein QXE91_01120 [Thermofilaceae archaeon]